MISRNPPTNSLDAELRGEKLWRPSNVLCAAIPVPDASCQAEQTCHSRTRKHPKRPRKPKMAPRHMYNRLTQRTCARSSHCWPVFRVYCLPSLTEHFGSPNTTSVTRHQVPILTRISRTFVHDPLPIEPRRDISKKNGRRLTKIQFCVYCKSGVFLKISWRHKTELSLLCFSSSHIWQ